MSTSEKFARAAELREALRAADTDPATTPVAREKIRREIHLIEGSL